MNGESDVKKSNSIRHITANTTHNIRFWNIFSHLEHTHLGTQKTKFTKLIFFLDDDDDDDDDTSTQTTKLEMAKWKWKSPYLKQQAKKTRKHTIFSNFHFVFNHLLIYEQERTH